MKASQNLFYLINSLTKAEKRYFSLNVLQNSKDKNFTKLFNEIELQTRAGSYDEEAIKAKFKNEKFIRQLTFTKNYLYNLIIKSLINFYSGDSIEARIYNLIISAKILFKKSLYDDYFKNLEIAKSLAERTERFGILLDIIKIQMRLIRLKDRKKNKGRNLFEEEKSIINKIENITSYSKLLNSFYSLTKIPDYARSKILYKEAIGIFENPLLNSEKNALSATAKDKYYQLLIYKNEFLENKKELFAIAVKRYELFQKNKIIFLADAENKEMQFLYEALLYAIFNNKNNYYNNGLKLYQAKFIKKEVNETNLSEESLNYYFLQMYYYYNRNNLTEALRYADIIYKDMRANEAIQNKDELLSFYFIYAKILYENKNHLSALNVTDTIIKHQYKDLRYDILSYSYFLEIFIHYELKNFQLVKSYLLALTRKLSHHKEKDLSEKVILKFFHELCSENKLDEKYVLKKYYKKFQILKKSKYERALFNDLPIDKWISKKIF